MTNLTLFHDHHEQFGGWNEALKKHYSFPTPVLTRHLKLVPRETDINTVISFVYYHCLIRCTYNPFPYSCKHTSQYLSQYCKLLYINSRWVILHFPDCFAVFSISHCASNAEERCADFTVSLTAVFCRVALVFQVCRQFDNTKGVVQARDEGVNVNNVQTHLNNLSVGLWRPPVFAGLCAQCTVLQPSRTEHGCPAAAGQYSSVKHVRNMS